MYSGDDFYGDEITSPLYRPLPTRRLESDDNITREQEADARPADLNYYGNSTLGFDADEPAPTALLVCPACHATMRFYGDFEPEFHKALTLTLEPDELVFCEACDANYGEGFALELIQEGD